MQRIHNLTTKMITLWQTNSLLLKMAQSIYVVSFPMKNGGSFHSYVNVYQRVNGNINPRIRVLGFYGDCQPPTAPR